MIICGFKVFFIEVEHDIIMIFSIKICTCKIKRFKEKIITVKQNKIRALVLLFTSKCLTSKTSFRKTNEKHFDRDTFHTRLFNKTKSKSTKYDEICSLIVFAQDFRKVKWLWEGNDHPFFSLSLPPFCCRALPVFEPHLCSSSPCKPPPTTTTFGLSSSTRTFSCRPSPRRYGGDACRGSLTSLSPPGLGARPAWVSLISTVSWCVISSHGVSVPKLLTAGLKGTQRRFSSPLQGHTKQLHASQSTHVWVILFSLWTCLQRVYLVFYA